MAYLIFVVSQFAFLGLAPLSGLCCATAPALARRRIGFHMRHIKNEVVTRLLPRTVRQACSQLPSRRLVPTRCHLAVMRINISCPQSKPYYSLPNRKKCSICAAAAIERSRIPVLWLTQQHDDSASLYISGPPVPFCGQAKSNAM
jgi:hypothetical protein